jgi:hypothetical protein
MPDAEKPTYRAYVIGSDNHIRAAKEIEAENDEAAIETVRPMVDGHAIEIWERKRLVIRLDPKSPEPKSPAQAFAFIPSACAAREI